MPFPTKKTWKRMGPTFQGQSRTNGFSSWTPYNEQTVASSGSLVSVNNGLLNFRDATSGDVGGVFELVRETTFIRGAKLKDGLVDGDIWATYNPAGLDTSKKVDRVTESDQRAAGTKAIALSAPNDPSTNLLTMLGELAKDGLPKIFGAGLAKEKANFLKGSSSEYLNYEFGWRPLISDLRSLAHSVLEADKIISQYKLQSDQKVRRRHVFPSEFLTTSFNGTVAMYPSRGMAGKSGNCTSVYTSEKDTWFSGAFRYHIPLGDSQLEKLAYHRSMAGKLLGLRLTPDTLWNLAPWSWAADWVANTGDVMTNISNLGTDGLAMEYGYMMGKTREEILTNWSWPVTKPDRSGMYRWTSEKKTRFKASPYGFTMTWDGLSTRQQAIVAALGITRSGRKG